MKFILLATAFAITAYAAPTDEWNQYKAKYNKVYTSETENMRRLEQYLKSKEMVEEHNRKYDRGETTYTMAINQFADWFPEEVNRLNGLQTRESVPAGNPFELPPGTVVPDSINWATKGAVTRIQEQGICNCGYAFSAVGALEALKFIKNGSTTDLSVQQLVDCTVKGGCHGGSPADCFSYVKEHGILKKVHYPYDERKKTCRARKLQPAAYCTGFKVINGEEQLKQVVGTVGPVSIGFAFHSSFTFYNTGIFDGLCTPNQNHWMLVVGYGTDEKTKTDYWLVKNSFGGLWGTNGYGKIIRNKNKCKLADGAMYPVYE